MGTVTHKAQPFPRGWARSNCRAALPQGFTQKLGAPVPCVRARVWVRVRVGARCLCRGWVRACLPCVWVRARCMGARACLCRGWVCACVRAPSAGVPRRPEPPLSLRAGLRSGGERGGPPGRTSCGLSPAARHGRCGRPRACVSLGGGGCRPDLAWRGMPTAPRRAPRRCRAGRSRSTS